MAENKMIVVFRACGFKQFGMQSCGTWKGYAASMRPLTNRSCNLDVAVRPQTPAGQLRRMLIAACKARGEKIGVQIGKLFVTFTLKLKGKEPADEQLRRQLDVITDALRENGLAPADTCAISGAEQPDSLCMVQTGAICSYQPVMGSQIHDRKQQAVERAEQNEQNGSYALGILGALLDMLLGLIPNLLTVVWMERIFALLFALVPIAAIFGYKLLGGRMDRTSIVIVILVSLLGVPVMIYFELVIYIVQEYGASLKEALSAALEVVKEVDFWREVSGELLQLLLFMGLGILFAWKTVTGQTNQGRVQLADAQLASLCPNPARQNVALEGDE